MSHDNSNNVKEHDDVVSDVMDTTADEYMAKTIAEVGDLPIATAKRIAKSRSAKAGLYEAQANMNGDRFERKRWGQVRTALKYYG